ncbi:class I SAM-dependent methyltransferase [Alteribacter natronophilus]|uniref:class I SAM-dependent methyltransferase n=1 Tax=Alteribacter natronophilus TaxID=2583810 RepID=UPI00110D3EC9|nr:class I SAM-dependent methyltransferase [Alteribacter natronophilus]TMW70990.1 class I SAM-dependent methyltransferase [Alteribacter natronophilus]
MDKKNSLWEKQYLNTDQLWASEPEAVLSKYADLVDKDGKVLDLGMGEGRNALYYGGKGFDVTGIDYSPTAVERTQEKAQQLGVKLDTSSGDLKDYEITPGSCSLIIMASVLNFFRDDEIDAILDKVEKGLKKGGLLYLNVFDTGEPGMQKLKQNAEEVSPHTFYRKKSDSYVHFFTREELEKRLVGFEMVHRSDYQSLDLSHGEPHMHSGIELFVRLKKS